MSLNSYFNKKLIIKKEKQITGTIQTEPIITKVLLNCNLENVHFAIYLL